MKAKVVYNKLLGGWYVVRGPHQTPLSGRFDSKADAVAYLNRDIPGYGSAGAKCLQRVAARMPVAWSPENGWEK